MRFSGIVVALNQNKINKLVIIIHLMFYRSVDVAHWKEQ